MCIYIIHYAFVISIVLDTHNALPTNMVSGLIHFHKKPSQLKGGSFRKLRTTTIAKALQSSAGFLSCCAHLIKNHEDHLAIAKSGFEEI